MIVDQGKPTLQDFQASGLAGCFWALFDNNVAITSSTVRSDLNEASFSGYARVNVGTMNSATLVSGRGQATPVTNPVFTNTGSDTTVFGWMLIDATTFILLAAVNLGSTLIPASQSYTLAPAVSTTEE